MKGSNITGGVSDRGRAEDDFYATNPNDVRNFLSCYGHDKIKGSVLEPCIGMGHIAKELNKLSSVDIDGFDIKDRNSGFNTKIECFLKAEVSKKYDFVITNPPYSLAEEFIRKSMNCIKENGSKDEPIIRWC